jgi:hypothetical protein
LAARVKPDAEAVEGSARRVSTRYEPATAPANAENACVGEAKSAGHAA